jgi:hypothetical protein
MDFKEAMQGRLRPPTHLVLPGITVKHVVGHNGSERAEICSAAPGISVETASVAASMEVQILNDPPDTDR